jgi:hypothetical protein
MLTTGHREECFRIVQTRLRAGQRETQCGERAAPVRFLFEHYNNVHPHSALGYLPPREFRKQMMEKATGNAVGAVRRPHDSPISADVIWSRPKPREAVARTASLGGLASNEFAARSQQDHNRNGFWL